MLEGRVIKAYNSFFYVMTESGLVSCKLRGKFKKRRQSAGVVPGDRVAIELLPEVKDRLIQKLTVSLPLTAVDDEFIAEMSALVKKSPGNTELAFYVQDEDGQMYVSLLSRTQKITVRKEMVNYLKSQPWLAYKIN